MFLKWEKGDTVAHRSPLSPYLRIHGFFVCLSLFLFLVSFVCSSSHTHS